MKEQIRIAFTIEAGKYDDYGKNWKYFDTAASLPEALLKYQNTQGYDFRDLSMDIEVDGVFQQTVWLFGGPQIELSMRMSIANLWVQATGNDFFDLTEGPTWEQQIDEIEACLMPRAERWQDIHAQFGQGRLSWTEAFDALMSRCGLPMEEALHCLAEHFDRRPAITAKEVN